MFLHCKPMESSLSVRLARYLDWLNLANNITALNTLHGLLIDGTEPHHLQTDAITIKQASTTREHAIIDGIIRLAYSRYTNGYFPIELSKNLSEQEKYEINYIAYSHLKFPLATLKSKIFSPQDKDYFVNQLFTVHESWYTEADVLHEVSRWAAHPLFDVYQSPQEKSVAMSQIMKHVYLHFEEHQMKTIGIFSERVAKYIQRFNILKLKKIKTSPKKNKLRENLETKYPLYWKADTPSVYLVSI